MTGRSGSGQAPAPRKTPMEVAFEAHKKARPGMTPREITAAAIEADRAQRGAPSE